MTTIKTIQYVVSLVAALSICCASAGLGSKAEIGSNPDNEHVALESLCANKPVRLVSISQVRQLIADSKSEPSDGTCNVYRNSLDNLDSILEVVESGKTCNLDLIDRIRVYNNEFITQISATKNGVETSTDRTRAKVPDSIRQFFMSLCFQLSAECKILMINSLEYDTKDKISEADYETIKMFERNGVTLLDEETTVTDFDDIILLDDLSNSLKDEQLQTPSKLLIKVKTNKLIRGLIKTCRNKFKPFYDKLIMPLIKLSNLGYNYQGELLARELEELKHNELVKRWYNIVQTCEAFNSVEIFEDPDMSLSSGRQAISFISSSEAEALMKKQQVAAENTGGDSADEPVEYEQVNTHSSDRLWIQDQRELERLISKYQAHANEADRIRTKLLKKLLDQVKAAFKSGQIFSLASHAVKSALPTELNVAKQRPNDVIAAEDFIQMIDEAVENSEHTVVVNGIDSPVAGQKYHRKEIPERINFVPKRVNGSKWSTKLYDRTLGAIIPSKWNILFWLMATAGILIIVLHIVG